MTWVSKHTPTMLHAPWEHTGLKLLSLAGLSTAALALAPVVIPAIIRTQETQLAEMAATSFCTTGAASGLVSTVAGAIGHIPFVGGALAAGGMWTVGAAVGIALGGMVLANYIDRHTPEGKFRWGAVVRWSSLATSILVSLPAILPAISMGLMFWGNWMGDYSMMDTAASIGSLGTSGAASAIGSAAGGAGLAALHAITCALPLGLAGFFIDRTEEKTKLPPFTLPPLPTLHAPALANGKIIAPHHTIHAA